MNPSTAAVTGYKNHRVFNFKNALETIFSYFSLNSVYRKRLLYLIIVPLVIAAFFVNLYVLNNQSIRLDESQSIWVATKPVETVIATVVQDIHVPLYSILLHFWLQIFGTEVFHARALSLVFLIANLPVLYLLAKDASNRFIALLTVVLFTLSPFILWYSNEARMYTLFTLVTTTNQYFFLKFLRSQGKEGKLGYFLSTAIGLYTHYFFILLILTQVLYMIGWYAQRVRRELGVMRLKILLKKHRALPITFVSLVGASFVLFLPWVIYFILFGIASNTQPIIPAPTSYNIFQTLILFLFGFQPNGIQTLLVSLWPLTLTILFFVFTRTTKTNVKNIEYFALASFMPILFTFIGSFIKPIFLSRYLILVTPTLFFMLAWFLTNYSKRISTFLITGFVAVTFMLSLYQTSSASTPVKENYRGVTEYLNKSVTPRDIITTSAPFTIYPIEYGYDGSARITTIPEWNRYIEGSIPPFTIENLDRQMKEFEKQYAYIYVVLSYDQGYESAIREYLDTHYHIEHQEKFSEELEVRVYKLRYDI